MKKKIIKILSISAILYNTINFPLTTYASEQDTDISEIKKEVIEHDEAANNLDSLMDSLKNEMEDTQSALNHLNDKIQEKEHFLKQAMEELDTAQEEMLTLEAEIDELEDNIEKRSGQLEEQARKVQINGNSSTYIDFVLSAESLTDIFARIDIVSKVVNSSSQMIEEQREDKEAVLLKEKETERKIIQQNALAEKLEESSSELESQKISQEALVAQLKIEQTTVASEKEILLEQRNEALNRAQELESERKSARLAAAEAESIRESGNVSRPSSSQVESAGEEEDSSDSDLAEKPEETTSPKKENAEPNRPTTNPETQTNEEVKAEKKPAPKPKPDPKPDPKPKPAPTGNVLSIASNYLGTPYLYGGSTTKAFDCSGYTSHVFSEAGKSIPRSSRAQYASATKVSNPQPGDLVFFGKSSITHVGIYLGGGRFIGSQSSTGVAYARLDQGYWSNRLIGYGRY
ncbi:MAG: NlpC/P60 family protein [Atopostipes suicloacalis]|nr:NlpC/P60 family protein [Atopostipes suicloacalis]